LAWVGVLRTARRGGHGCPAVQERTCELSVRLPAASVMVLGQASATIAERDLEGPDAGDLRRRP